MTCATSAHMASPPVQKKDFRVWGSQVGWDRYRLGHRAVGVLAGAPPLNVQSGHSKAQTKGRAVLRWDHTLIRGGYKVDKTTNLPKFIMWEPSQATLDKEINSAARLRHVIVEEGIHTVGALAWQNCRRLRIVKLPITVVRIDESAFRGCHWLNSSCIRLHGLRLQGLC